MAIVGISTAIIDIRAMDHATGSLRGIASNISQMGRAISGAGLAMTASFTIPMVAAGVASIKLATEFDKSMRNIQAIGKQTDSEIATLGQRFITQSQDITKTTASAQELADAFYYVQSSGQSGQDALNIIDSAAKGATAGLSDVQSVAKSLTSIINSYGMQSSEAATLTDMLVRSVDIGVFTFQDINSQIGDFINTASLMKIPLEQVLAVMTAVTKKGIPVSEAATSLNQMLVAYLKPSKEAVAVAKEFGIELSASTIEAMGFAGALQDMYNKTGGSEEAMAQIFRNIRSFRGVAALASDGLKSYNQDVITLKNSAGTTDQVFSVATKSWDSILKNFKNTIEATSIAIGTILLPMLTQLAAGISRLAASFQKLAPATQESLVKFAIAFAALGPALIVIGQLINAVGILVGVFSGIAIIPAIIGAIAAGAALAGLAMSFWNDNTMGVADKMQKLADSGGIVGGIFEALIYAMETLKSVGFFSEHVPLLDLLTGDKISIDINPVILLAEAIEAAFEAVVMLRTGFELAANSISFMLEAGQRAFQQLSVFIGAIAEKLTITGETLRAIWDSRTLGEAASAISRNEARQVAIDAKANATLYGETVRLHGPNGNTSIRKPGLVDAPWQSDYAGKQQEILAQAGKEIAALRTLLKKSAEETGPQRKSLQDIIQHGFDISAARKGKVGPDMTAATMGGQPFDAAANAQAFSENTKKWASLFGVTSKQMQDYLTGMADAPTSEEIAAKLAAIADSGASDSLNKLTTAANPLVDAFNSIFQAAAQASKNLMDLTGVPGAGGVTPGANGPFEDIYRLQAWIKDKTHGDVAAKAGVTTDEQAKSIVGAFQNNNWAPAIAAGLIDKDKLNAMGIAQMASTATGLGDNPYGASNLAALQGMGLTATQASAVAPGVKPVTTTQQVGGGGGATPGVQTAPDMAKVAKQMSDDADKNAKAIGEAGAKVFGIWEGGFFGAADKSNLMVSLVDRLVQNAIMQYMPKDKK